MKVIGLIGGMSWESSLEYYKIVNETVKQKLGPLHSSKCIMYSVDFYEVEELQRRGDWSRLGDIMVDAAKSLEKAGADFIVICTNTMHKLVDIVQKHIEIPLLHIADCTAEAVKTEGLAKVGLLGTKFTMEEDFYKKRLKEHHGIEVIIPSESDRQKVHDIIYNELVCGIIKESSKQQYRRIITCLIDEGAQGIILGCTEIFIIVDKADYDIKIFDTTSIHARYAAKASLL